MHAGETPEEEEEEQATASSCSQASVPEGLVTHFFARGEQMERSICVLCSNAHEGDHIVSTLGIMLTRPLQLTLTSVGLQPFQGRELTFPYHMMSQGQRRFLSDLLGILPEAGLWNKFESALVYNVRSYATLDPADVLESFCAHILRTKVLHDLRTRVALCNILLQRMQASVPISKGVQAQLNARLFQVGAG
jgi:hypothetical protein